MNYLLPKYQFMAKTSQHPQGNHLHQRQGGGGLQMIFFSCGKLGEVTENIRTFAPASRTQTQTNPQPNMHSTHNPSSIIRNLAEKHAFQYVTVSSSYIEGLDLEIEKAQASEQAQFASPEENDSVASAMLRNQYGDFAPFATGEREFYTVENNLMKIKFTNLGGRIASVELKNYDT